MLSPSTGEILSFVYSGGMATDPQDYTNGLTDLPSAASSFGEDAAGELYVIDYGGRILKFIPRP